ncbi:MAG TPA: VTT domain-containing protein, partial [Thermoanaerobaculia bacterium]
FKRPKSLLFNPAHLRRAHDFYEKHGGKTILIARFMPVIRTFAPIVAGMGEMNYRRFLSFNVFGGIFWVISMTGIGYFLGKIPGVREHIEIVIIIVVFLSILPGIIAFAREWMKKRRENPAGNR